MTVSGKVVEEDSELPINTVVLIQVDGFNSVKTSTDSHGNFTANIPVTKEFKIIVNAPGFEAQENTIHYPIYEEGAPNDLEIKLTPYVKLIVDGSITNENNNPPGEVKFNIYKFSDYLVDDSKVIQDGKFTQKITDFGWYMIDLSSPGYLDVTDTVWVLNCSRKIIHKDYHLTPIEKGLTLQLNEIHFNFGKATLTPDSDPELDKVVNLLSNNPSLHAEISGHTDNEGPADYNLFLSQLRAQSVVDYLIKKGIHQDQLIAKGYGETKPLVSNDSYEGRVKNRRVELVVLNE